MLFTPAVHFRPMSFSSFYPTQSHSSFFFLNNLDIYFFSIYFLFLAVLGLRCCVQASSSCVERGLLFIVVHGLLIVVASLVAEHGL